MYLMDLFVPSERLMMIFSAGSSGGSIIVGPSGPSGGSGLGSSDPVPGLLPPSGGIGSPSHSSSSKFSWAFTKSQMVK